MIPTRTVVIYVIVTVAVTTLISLPFLLGAVPTEQLAPLVPLAQLTPALVALVLNRFRPQGRIRDLWAVRGGTKKAFGGGMLLAVAALVLVPVVQLAIGVATGLVSWEPAAGAVAVIAAIPVVLVAQTLFAAGEELGWRGYLHSLLRPIGFWRTAAVIGAVWALWHVPVAVTLGVAGEIPTRMAFTYCLDLIPIALLFAALRERSASVWPAVLAHGLLNSVRVYLLQNLITPEAALGDAAFWGFHAVGWVLWIAAAFVIVRRRDIAPAVAGPLEETSSPAGKPAAH
ncbi:MAG: lysostaphin resistance A-like protein [Propionibacteriaceae bacterium]